MTLAIIFFLVLETEFAVVQNVGLTFFIILAMHLPFT